MKLGYYKVGEKVFFEKLDAILYASTTLENVTWNFNDEIFQEVNWTTEPSLSLSELYKIRAKQIREQFDYIILFASGGADSTNMIYSFLNNGIYVDEIVASAPISGLSNLNETASDNRAENTYSETFTAQLPLMKELADRYPSTRFTLNDYFDTLVNFKEDAWLLKSGEWIHPSGLARYSLEKFKHLRDLADSGKRIGILYGIDKPNLIVDNAGNMFSSLGDIAVNVQRKSFERDYLNVENVLFYYAPELPDIMIKQAHLVAKWIFKPENQNVLKYLRNIDLIIPFERNRVRQSYWERAIVPCIYPDTARKIFQAHKPTRMFLGEHDGWFYEKHYNTKIYQMIDSDFRNFFKMINPKYLNGPKTGLEPFRKDYFIGNASNFKS
jgi:hypothetical protein